MGSLLGDDSVDYGRYDLGYDEGAWNSFSRKFWGFLTQLVWSCVTWLVGIGSWLLTWSLQFGFARLLADPAGRVAAVWQSQIVSRLGLTGFLLCCAAVWAGAQVLRGRTHRGLAELGLSLVIGAVGATVLADPAGTLLGDGGLLGKTRNLSLEIAAVTVVDNPGQAPGGGDYATVVKPMTAALARGLVVEPHMLLNWGQSLDDPAHPRPSCLTAYQQLVAAGPHGSDDEPRQRMTAAGCSDLADFNHDPGPDRLLGAVMVLIAAVLVIILLVLIAGGLAAAQIALAWFACLAVFAMPLGLLPVAGRMALVSWCTSVLKALAAVIATVAFLALFLVVLTATVTDGGGGSLLGRLALLDVLVLCSFVARKRISAAFTRVIAAAGYSLSHASRSLGADSFTRALNRGGGGYGMRAFGAGAAGGMTAAALGQLWSENTAEIRQVTAPVQAAARRAVHSQPARLARDTTMAAGRVTAAVGRDAARYAGTNLAAAGRTAATYASSHGEDWAGRGAARVSRAARTGSLAAAFGLAIPTSDPRPAARRPPAAEAPRHPGAASPPRSGAIPGPPPRPKPPPTPTGDSSAAARATQLRRQLSRPAPTARRPRPPTRPPRPRDGQDS